MARSQSIGTKLTPDEERQILVAAEADGKAPSEWARDLLLRGESQAIVERRRCISSLSLWVSRCS